MTNTEMTTEFLELAKAVLPANANKPQIHAAWLMFRAMKEREAALVPIVNAARERKFGDIVAEAFSAAKGGGK